MLFNGGERRSTAPGKLFEAIQIYKTWVRSRSNKIFAEFSNNKNIAGVLSVCLRRKTGHPYIILFKTAIYNIMLLIIRHGIAKFLRVRVHSSVLSNNLEMSVHSTIHSPFSIPISKPYTCYSEVDPIEFSDTLAFRVYSVYRTAM